MHSVDAQDLERAIRTMGDVLEPLSARDWSVPAGTLDRTCRETLAHLGHELLAYATNVAGRPQDSYLTPELVTLDDLPVSAMLPAVETCGGLLVTALLAATPNLPTWHSRPNDVSGFAALGVAEVVLHTYDITRGLKVNWWPPAKFSTRILARLAPEEATRQQQKTGKRHHPTQVLLRYTGRLGDVGPWQWLTAPQKQTDANPVRDDESRGRSTPSDDALARRRVEWLQQYTSLKNVVAAERDVPYTCPCCGHATLSARGSYEICDECGWEDDGQDNHDSASVRGGPNGSMSLDDARILYIRRGRGRTPQPHFPPTQPT
jgi:predicted RNA-binding Zn-ribbon protein involved in translation (DUF1610 family)